jgi:hypothetical protein
MATKNNHLEPLVSDLFFGKLLLIRLENIHFLVLVVVFSGLFFIVWKKNLRGNKNTLTIKAKNPMMPNNALEPLVSDLFFGKLLLIRLENIHFLVLVVVILDWNLSVLP